MTLSIRTQIVEQIARTLYVCTYADHAEQCEVDGCPVCGESGIAYGGQDWFDVAPSGYPEDALATAEILVETFERFNGLDIATAYERASAQQEALPHKSWWRDPTVDEFGYCIAMEALGHGVGWYDSHPNHEFTVPRVEYYLDF